MGKINQNLFKKGKWCPLFGSLPIFTNHSRNSIHNRLIDTIREARSFWGIDDDLYDIACPKEHPFVWDIEKESFFNACKRAPQKSRLKWNFGISGPEVRTVRLIYLTFMRGSMYSQKADIDPSQEEMWYLESRADSIAGVETEIKGIRLLALLAICNAASALYDLLHRHESEKNWSVMKSFIEAQNFLFRIKETERQNELSDLIEKETRLDEAVEYIYDLEDGLTELEPIIDIGINTSKNQSERVKIRHENEKPAIEARNSYIWKKFQDMRKERRSNVSDETIKKEIVEMLPNDPGYTWIPVKLSTVKNITKESKNRL